MFGYLEEMGELAELEIAAGGRGGAGMKYVDEYRDEAEARRYLEALRRID